MIIPTTSDHKQALLKYLQNYFSEHYSDSMIDEGSFEQQWWQDLRFVAITDSHVRGYILSGEFEDNPHSFDMFADDESTYQALYTTLTNVLPKDIQLTTRAISSDAALNQVLQAQGFAIKISFLTMKIILDQQPVSVDLPEGIEIRRAIKNRDEQAIYLVDEAASRGKSYGSPMDFEKWKRRMDIVDADFDHWWLATKDDDIVGVCLNAISDRRTAIIDHLGVLNSYRGQGIGGALMKTAFSGFFEAGITDIQLNVESNGPT